MIDSNDLEVLFTEDAIQKKVAELGQQIYNDYKDFSDQLVLVGVMKGAVFFLTDLARRINLPLEIEIMGLSSYGDATESSGVVQITQDLKKPIAGKHVILVEDLIDTGLTAKYLLENFKSRNAKSLKLCTLLEKPSKNEKKIKPDYLGFKIQDEFVIGYGLDYAEKYRNLPYIGFFKPEVLQRMGL